MSRTLPLRAEGVRAAAPKATTCRNRKGETRAFLETAMLHGLDPADFPATETRVWHAAAWALVAHLRHLQEHAELDRIKRETDLSDERRRIMRQLQGERWLHE